MHYPKIFGVLFIVFLSSLNALEIDLNSGKEAGKSFSVLKIEHNEPFTCQETFNRFSEIEKVVCTIKGELGRGFSFNQTLFFKIDAFADKENSILVITPKKKARLFALNQDSKRSTPIIKERPTLSARWQVVGYEDKIPFLSSQNPVGLNFPITIQSSTTPHIGALDIAKKPLIIDESPDTQLYVSIKGFMERESYGEAVSTINDTLLRYPDSIFKKDLLLFKIRALFKQNDPDITEEMISLARGWLKAYPADGGVSEVLYILAKTYGQQRFYEEARYYYDRLKEEHIGDNFEILSRISLADDLLERGDSKIAPQLYISALNDATNIDTASLASYRLADYYITKDQTDQFDNAKTLLNQVVNANPKLFHNLPSQALLDNLGAWAEKGFFDPTGKIAEIVYNGIKDGNDDALTEAFLRNAAIWYEGAADFPNANRVYQEYLKLYPIGETHKEMVRRADNLLFSYNEGNVTKRLEDLDRVIATYPDSEEAQKAYELKANLLIQQGDFSDAVNLEKNLGAEHPTVLQAATGAVRRSLHNNDCTTAAYYLQRYPNLDLNQDELLKGFDCLAEGSFFDDALRLSAQAEPNIENITRRLDWLYRIATTQQRKGDYPKAIKAARDGLDLNDSLATGKYDDISFILINSLLKEQRIEEAMQYLPRLEEMFKDDDRMIEIQKELLNAAAKKDDRPAIELYAKELLRLQELHKRPEYSPWAELTYVESLIKSNRLEEALAILNQSEQLPLNDDERAKVLYNKGSVADSLTFTPLSQESYEKCTQVEGNSPYKKLCADALGLLNQRTQKGNNQPLPPPIPEQIEPATPPEEPQ
ncbi:hypothetical protein CCZ01_00655 [Helicobacter monodelphidis]|uniref:DUF7494 domain-containing protein n=1 Tax=Helicobacter sp. 15-1451 TaxID=2004995 RepID=UPI000DCEDC12|nr:outer membrane protein assembly factor BamD [Helicobacter sp. 15-1451]RAX59281.1 hypothetical protein CCZ01_00655 [Helicobacter sp. 15-1451]